MKKFFTVFFVVLGVIFSIILIAGAYFYVTDPYNLKPLFFGTPSSESSSFESKKTSSSSDSSDSSKTSDSSDSSGSSQTTKSSGNSDSADSSTSSIILSPDQQQALENLGVDPSQIPSQITSEQEECFVGILGQVRVDQIKAGAQPTVSEFISGRNCMQ